MTDHVTITVPVGQPVLPVRFEVERECDGCHDCEPQKFAGVVTNNACHGSGTVKRVVEGWVPFGFASPMAVEKMYAKGWQPDPGQGELREVSCDT
jgi:hypothetical protein